MKQILPWIVVLGLVAGLGFLYSSNKKQTAEVKQLQEENQQLRAASEEAQKGQAQSQNDELTRLRKENEDLIRLRNEVRQLRDEKQQLTKQVQTVQNQAQNAQAQAQHAQAQMQALSATRGANPTPGQQLSPAEAEAFRARYGLAPGAAIDPLNTCINNLRQIDGAKQQWALEHKKPVNTLVAATDISPYLRGNALPTCPSGGTYTVNPVGTSPTCSIPGHVLPKQ